MFWKSYIEEKNQVSILTKQNKTKQKKKKKKAYHIYPTLRSGRI